MKLEKGLLTFDFSAEPKVLVDDVKKDIFSKVPYSKELERRIEKSILTFESDKISDKTNFVELCSKTILSL